MFAMEQVSVDLVWFILLVVLAIVGVVAIVGRRLF